MTEEKQNAGWLEPLVEGGAVIALVSGLLLFIGLVSSVAHSRALGVANYSIEPTSLTSDGGIALMRAFQHFLMPITSPNQFLDSLMDAWTFDTSIVFLLVATGVFLACATAAHLIQSIRSRRFSKDVTGIFAIMLALLLLYMQQQTLEFSNALSFSQTSDQTDYLLSLDSSDIFQRREISEVLESIVFYAGNADPGVSYGMGDPSSLREIRYWVIVVCSSIILFFGWRFCTPVGKPITRPTICYFLFVLSQLIYLPVCHGILGSNFDYAIGNLHLKNATGEFEELDSVFFLGKTNEGGVFYSRIRGFRTYIIPWDMVGRFEQEGSMSVFSNCAYDRKDTEFWPCEL